MKLQHLLPLVCGVLLGTQTVSGSLPRITDIVVEGNTLVTDDAILHRLPYRKETVFDAAQSDEAISSVYRLGTFSQVILEQESGVDNTVKLFVTVVEKPHLTNVTFAGNSAISTTKLKEVITISTLKTVDDETGKTLANAIRKEYHESDYHNAVVISQVIPDPEDASKAQLHFDINEDVRTTIRRVRFRGNSLIPGRTIRKFLENREQNLFGFISGAGKFNEQTLEIDKERVRMVYMEHGYFTARVTDTEVTVSQDRKHLDIIFTVQEGPQFTIKEIDVTPDPDVPHMFLRRCLSLAPGDTYKQSELHKMMEALKKVYGQYGFIDAQAAPQVVPDMDNNTISITFQVNKGQKWSLNRVLITGNETTRDHVIRRQLFLEEGAPLTSTAMEESKRAVEYLSYFDREGIEWIKHPLPNDMLDLELHVKEAKTRQFQAGMNFGPSKDNAKGGVKGFMSMDLKNMFGQGWDTGLNIQVAKKTASEIAPAVTRSVGTQTPQKEDKQPGSQTGFPVELSQLSFNISDPYLFGSEIAGSFALSYNKAVYDQWQWVAPVPQEHIIGVTGRLGMRLPRLRATTLRLEAGLEKISNNNEMINGQERLRIKPEVHTSEVPRYRMLLDQKLQPGTLGWIGLDIAKDTRNHQVYPNDGYRLAFSTKLAPPGFNRTFSFVKSTLNASWYTPLIGFDTLVLGLKGFAGYVEQIGPNRTTESVNNNGVRVSREKGIIPYRELFNLGGSDSIRGFNWGEVGPSWNYQNPLGGKKAVQMTAELIFPLLDNYHMKVHLFYDAGCAWDTPRTSILNQYNDLIKSDTFNLRHTIGIGLNITQPQPLKLSFGYKLNRRAATNDTPGESPHEFHIGMNAAF